MSSFYKLPDTGLTKEQVLAEVEALFEGMTPDQKGKMSSTSFKGRPDMQEVVQNASLKFFSWNALFTFQEASAAKIENEVLDMCMSLVSGDESTRANLTSGGTESNFCAFHAMRNWARKTKSQIKEPELVAPYSIHSTVHKVCQILDIKVVTVPQLDNLSVDIEGIKAAITDNTIGVAGSAVNWPYGTVDPIEAFAAIALEKDLWLHVDACVGGYVLPFFRELGEDIPKYDFSVDGVRSISADLHKYGYAPKPCSTVLWRSQQEQEHHYIPITDWPCGLYLSQGFVGSRPLSSAAGAWAIMHYLGREGYKENAQKILTQRKRIEAQIAEIDGLTTWKSHGPLLQIASTGEINILLVVGGMEKLGWRLLGVNTPPAIHLTVDVMDPDVFDQFLSDMKQVIEQIQAGEITDEGLLSYGGVGAEETAPKWLLSAVEIMEKQAIT